MHVSQRYRDKAVDCLLAARDCSRYYREIHLSLAAIWLALARHDEAMNDLLANWDMAKPVKTDRLRAHHGRFLYLVK
jgi:hypothetical protein